MTDGVQVRVRMYRQGLGDCFLLTFADRDDDARPPVHVLIDCGVDWSTRGGSEGIRKVARHIRDTTHGHLDLLVVTHEHWDHVSGFERAREVFEAMSIDRVWLAWTEDPEDELAAELDAERSVALRAAAHGARELVRSSVLADDERRSLSRTGRATAEVLRFLGVDALGPMGFSKTSDAAMDFVSSLKTDGLYCRPGGSPLAIDTLPGVRFYVLGPPRDEALLKRMDPSSSAPETYELGGTFGERRSLFAAMQADGERRRAADAPQLLGADEMRRLRDYPFTDNRRVEQGSPEARALHERSYFDQAQSWRRIDADWLTSVADLALQLDNAVNNTSLVLAVELVESGRVLLFAADAQIGNWLSWHDHEWTVPDADGAERRVTADELLARTVLYKVGHHGSHNATLREHGLEKMTSPDLVAMLPVHEAFAHDTKGWRMPHEPLYEGLLERTAGRILRVDSDFPGGDAERPESLSEEQWDAFRDAVTVDGLFLEYRL